MALDHGDPAARASELEPICLRVSGDGVTARAAFKQDDVKRAVNGVVAAGLSVARIEVEHGRIVVIVGDPSKERANPLDRLYG